MLLVGHRDSYMVVASTTPQFLATEVTGLAVVAQRRFPPRLTLLRPSLPEGVSDGKR